MGPRVLGTLLIAPEGINGTIAGDRDDVQRVLNAIGLLGFDGLNLKWSQCDQPPFRRAKVRLKREIVTLGVDGIDPPADAGVYVDPGQWNELLDDPDVVLIRHSQRLRNPDRDISPVR